MYDGKKVEEIRRALEEWEETGLQQSMERLP